MDAAEALIPDIASDCSSATRIYSGGSHTGSMRAFVTRNTPIDLATYGFNNITSSYEIGACAARFYDGGFGSTPYPGYTGAWASANWMASGWDNRISTIYIY